MPRQPMTAEEFAQMRQRLLAETARIVASDGFPAMSMRKLADRVGLTAGALYRYFPTKHHLIVAMFADAIGELNARLGAAAQRGSEPTGVLREMLRDYGRFCVADHDRFRLLFLENDVGFTTAVSEHPDTFTGYQLVVAQADAAVAAGDLVAPSGEAAAQLLWAAVHGAATLIITVPELSFGDAEEFIAGAVDMALSGLAPRTPRA